jgi:oxygen-independent coproporphyrinogen-3 oxidase
MTPSLPAGEPAPRDGALPAGATASLGSRPFGIYVHVPFCAARCGYCDFNTYVASESTDVAGYVDAVLAELALARRVLGAAPPAAETVFFGGGTPTLLAPTSLARILEAAEPAAGAEVTVEANPETVDFRALRELRAAGVTRLSVGMQSAAPHVLRTLDRRHAPGRPEAVVAAARDAGFEHVSLDLIYGTPGESDADWVASVRAAVGTGTDHVSAYALTVEPGTALAARVRRGELPSPDEDVQARRYAIADDLLEAAGLRWYEISNWAASPAARSRHNLGYWRSHDWWGAGPGAHSHVGGVRWWNVLHPDRYGARLRAGSSPAAGREVLTADQRRTERVLLGVRLAGGLALEPAQRAAAEALAEQGLVRLTGDGRRVVLTRRGRMLADTVARALLEPAPVAA